MTFVRDKSGSTTIMFAACGMAVLAAGAAAFEMSRVTTAGTQLQDAADTAALRAINLMVSGQATDAVVRTSAAEHVAALFRKDQGSVSVTTRVTSREPAAVELNIQRQHPLIFGGLVGRETATVSRTAVATVAKTEPVCLLVLDADAAPAIAIGGTADLVAPKCVVQVNSSRAGALAVSGSGTARTKHTMVSAAKISEKAFRPAPAVNSPSLADPYAARITWPAPPKCDYDAAVVDQGSGPLTLKPGVICGDLEIKKREVTLQAGVYILRDGDLRLSSGALLRAPYGTTIVMLGADSTVEVRAGARLELTAPTAGPWEGIALAQKPQPQERTSTVIGGGEIAIDGIVYLPTQLLVVTGGGSGTSKSWGGLVVNRVELKGNGQLNLAGGLKDLLVPGSVRLAQ